MPVSETQGPRRVGRSILALLTGIVAGIVLSVGTDAAMHATGIFPPLGQPMSDGLFGLATAYRLVYSVLASYIIARLAPHRPMVHAMIGGTLGLVVSAIGAIVTWNRGPEFGPHWYPLALVATALPTAWLGAKFHLAQHSRR